MIRKTEQKERDERASRLVWARKKAGLAGPRQVAERFGFNENNYKAHEAGRNGFGVADARKYADAFGVSLNWLYFNIGKPDARAAESRDIVDVPLIAWVSAGAMLKEDVTDGQNIRTLAVAGLPEGDWIALRVAGDSMDLISPPDSVIFVNRNDKRLVPNGLYVIADEDGTATYKRYRPGPPEKFEPVSQNKTLKAVVPENEATVIGRVRRTVLDM